MSPFLTAKDILHPEQSIADNPEHIIGYKALSEQNEHIGTIKDYIFDGHNRLRYLVVDTGFWIFGKTIVVPAGLVSIDDDRQEVILKTLTKDKVDMLPAYQPDSAFDATSEDNVLRHYYPEQSLDRKPDGQLQYENFDQDFRIPDRLQLLEERVQVNKRQEKTGDVNLRKTVENRQESVEVPITREKLVIETRPVTQQASTPGQMAGQAVASAQQPFKDDSVITIPLHEERADLTKQTVVAQEVVIRREQEVVTQHLTADVQVEHLDVETGANALNVEQRGGAGMAPDRGAMDKSAAMQGRQSENTALSDDVVLNEPDRHRSVSTPPIK